MYRAWEWSTAVASNAKGLSWMGGTLRLWVVLTRSKFEADMRLATLHDIVDSETRLCIVGDPCQVKALLKTLRCTSSLHASCGISVCVMDWILDVAC